MKDASPRQLSDRLRGALAKVGRFPSAVGGKLARTGWFASHDSLYKVALLLQGASLDPTEPGPPPSDRNRALGSSDEVEAALTRIGALGLHTHPTTPKNWDAFLALQTILEETDEEATVLDAGGETYSPLVEWLYLYGYRDLYAMNIDFDADFRRGPIQYLKGDFTDTSFDPGSFDAITSLSVVEHDVDVESMLREFHRLLSPGGRLIVSTDFWPEEIRTRETISYGGESQRWSILDEEDVRTFVSNAESAGFEPTVPIDLTADERVVAWGGHNYTFLYLELEKCG